MLNIQLSILFWVCQLVCLRPRIYAGMELEFLSAGTVVKFIIKSSCLLLSLIRVSSAETTDEIYSTAHCYHVSRACINAMLCGVIRFIF
jgi:hypothetical protein